MFALQEVAVQVKTKNECEDCHFFRYCALCGSRFPTEPCPQASPLQRHSTPLVTRSTRPGDDEVEAITDYSWRNFFCAINFVHILQKLAKGRVHRILLLVQYKSSASIKRILRANQPTLQLYVLKVIKSQVPFCGRKWRQANMKVITAIYLNCRANLRDQWLLGVDLDGEVEDSFPQDQARGVFGQQTKLGKDEGVQQPLPSARISLNTPPYLPPYKSYLKMELRERCVPRQWVLRHLEERDTT
ncbi:hypothetical protein Pst134EB_016793 [Puccinia striiformis f. sp. tritici]|nr:hypothetical protein Pst134EB_016793 [Puccinia striiformis f. sp. tritici]